MAEFITLIRHGEVAQPYQKRYIGRTDPGLSAPGRRQCRGLRHLCCDLVIASPLRRAVETAAVIEAPCRTDARLAEIDFGDWEMLTFEEIGSRTHPEVIRQWFADPAAMVFPGGEATADFYTRVDAAMAEIMALPESHVAVVTHGGVLMRVISTWRNLPPKEQFGCLIGRGEMVCWQKINGVWYEK